MAAKLSSHLLDKNFFIKYYGLCPNKVHGKNPKFQLQPKCLRDYHRFLCFQLLYVVDEGQS